MLALALPRVKRGQKFAFSFDEDEVTLAWDAVQAARLAPGTALAVEGIEPPSWWWAGTRLKAQADAEVVLRPVPTTVGPSVAVIAKSGAADVESAARNRYATAATRPEPEWQKHRLARDMPDSEADFPLGAFVLAARHDQVTAERMRMGPGKVVSWTTVGAGAAPTEFQRLQDAVGAYHVVLVQLEGGGRTVGLWTETEAPRTGQACTPMLRRLFRTQGAWRHGVKFAPTP